MKSCGKLSTATSPGAARGFSLIEVVIAIGIVGFGLIAILGLLPLALDGERQSQDETHMTHIAAQIFAGLESRGTFEKDVNTPVTVLAAGVVTAPPLAYYSTSEQVVSPGASTSDPDAGRAYVVKLQLAKAQVPAFPLGPSMFMATLIVAHDTPQNESLLSAPTLPAAQQLQKESETFLQLVGSYP